MVLVSFFSGFAEGDCKPLQIGPGSGLNGHDACDRNTVLIEDERHALVADPIDAVSKLASRLSHANDQFSHKIRLSENTQSDVKFLLFRGELF